MKNNKSSENKDIFSAVYLRHGRYWIPADSPASLRFYIENLFIPHSRRELLGSKGLLRFPWLSRKILFTYDHRSEKDDFPLPKIDCESLSLRLQDRLGKPQLFCSGFLNYILLDDYQHANRRQTLLFLFDEKTFSPCAIAKMTDNALQREVLEHEFKTLSFLQEELPYDLRQSIPQPITFFQEEGLWILVETFLAGKSLYTEMRNSWWSREAAGRHFQQAEKWLVQFHRATHTTELLFDEESIHKHILTLLQEFQECCEPSDAEQKMIRHIAECAQSMRGEKLPLVGCHGDFWPRNFILEGEKAGVVDWERFQPDSAPFRDLFMFPISYSLGYPWKWGHWGKPSDTFRAAFLEKTWLSDLVRVFLQSYCNEMNINSEWLEIFFTVFLARRTLENRDLITSQFSQVYQLWRNLFYKYAQVGGSVCFG